MSRCRSCPRRGFGQRQESGMDTNQHPILYVHPKFQLVLPEILLDNHPATDQLAQLDSAELSSPEEKLLTATAVKLLYLQQCLLSQTVMHQ